MSLTPIYPFERVGALPMLQSIKVVLRDQLGLPPFTVLLAAGCISHLVLNALLHKSPTSAWGLLAPLFLGVALESCEIWLQYGNLGLLAPGNDPLLTILSRHGLDVATMLAVPLVLVTLGRLRSHRKL